MGKNYVRKVSVELEDVEIVVVNFGGSFMIYVRAENKKILEEAELVLVNEGLPGVIGHDLTFQIQKLINTTINTPLSGD